MKKNKTGIAGTYVKGFSLCGGPLTCFNWWPFVCLSLHVSTHRTDIFIRLNNNRMTQPAELQPCSFLFPHPFFPMPLSVAGVTAGPDVAFGQSGFVLQMAPVLSLPLYVSPLPLPLCASVVCSCTPAPNIYSYANRSSWLISPHTGALSIWSPI